MLRVLVLAALFACSCDKTQAPAGVTEKTPETKSDKTGEPDNTGKTGEPDEDPLRPPSPDDTCDQAHAKRVRALLDQQCALAEGAPAGMVEVDRAAKAAPKNAIAIDLPASGSLEIAGRDVPAGLWDTSIGQEIGRAAAARGIKGRPQLALRIGALNNRSRVAALLKQVTQMGFTDAFLVLSGTEKLHVPAPLDAALAKKIHADLNRRPDQRAVAMAKRVEALVAGCQPAQELFAALSTASPDARCSRLSRGLGDAMLACGCPKEETELLTALHVMIVQDADGSQSVAVRVRLDPDPTLPASPKSTDDFSSWADVVATLDLSEEPVVLGTKEF